MHRSLQMGLRTRRSVPCATVIAVVLAAATLIPGGPAPLAAPQARAGGAKPAACTTAQLKPELGDVMVNQGLNYPILNRGKQTLIRLFLRLPTTCTAGSTITMTGASLTVTLTDVNGVPLTGTSVTVNPIQAVSGNLTAATQTNAASDPLFVVPASALTPSATTGAFKASFTATVSYKVGTTPFTGQAPAVVAGGPALPFTARFEPKTSALRILVVPMGDASSTATQFSSAAQAATQNALLDLSRMGPFTDGVGNLTSSATGGVRYSIDPGLMDIGPTSPTPVITPSGTYFCGTASNFPQLSSALTARLQNYNAANPTAQADRVLGVVDAAISWGATGHSCDEGRAAVPSGGKSAVAAWVRAVADGTYPSQTGAVLAQEILHTFAGCASASSTDTRCPIGTYHSTTSTDFSSARGYNLISRSWLSTPPTIMRYNPTASVWNRTTTLYETPDYLLFSCIVTPGFVLPTGYTSIPGCTTATTGSAGTSSGVPAGPTFFMTGWTDGVSAQTACPAPPAVRYKADGTTVFDSFYQSTTADLNDQAVDATSPYRLRFYDANGTRLADYGVPTGSSDAFDNSGSGSDSAVVTFSVAFPFDVAGTETNVQQVRLVKTSDSDLAGVVLWCRNRTAPPSITSTTLSTAGLVAFAWRDPGPLPLILGSAKLDGTALQPIWQSLAPSGLNSPVWSPDGSRLAFWDYGYHSYRVVNADGTGEHGIGPGMAAYFSETWSPDGQRVAYLANVTQSGGTVRIVDATVVPYAVVGDITYPGVTMYYPAWSPDGSRFAAYDDGSLPGGVQHPRIIVASANGSGTPVEVSTSRNPPLAGGYPAWSPDGSRIAYQSERDGLVSIVTVPSGGGGPATTVVTDPGSGGPLHHPDWSADGRQILFGKYETGPGQAALYTVDSAGGGTPALVVRALTITTGLSEAWGSWSHAMPGGSGVVDSATPDDVTVTLTYTCPVTGQVFPVAIGIPASRVGDAEATFFASFQPTQACASGTLVATAKDGFSASAPYVLDQAVTIVSQPLGVAINSPVNDRSYGPADTVALEGRVLDQDTGNLCLESTGACAWSLTHGDVTGSVGSGLSVDLIPGVNVPAAFVSAGAWKPGTYAATLAATTPSGTTSASVTFHIPAAPPVVTLAGPVDGAVYPLGSVPTPACVTTDSGTGVATSARLTVAGGDANGVGLFTVTCAGATSATTPPLTAAPVSVVYTVQYTGVGGIQQPINPDNTSVFNRTRVVPVKLQIAGSPPATGYATGGWTIALQPVSCGSFDATDAEVENVLSNTPFATFRWDATAQQYLYNAQLPSSLKSGQCAVFRVTLDDGSSIQGPTVIVSPIFKAK